ncbi:hypothetical protein [Enterobacter ludwigii]|uniref:hypothetical protein n=1 Tax=Enterobacter ludwigii TaxID=299767 RepID=UPI003F6FB0AE
MTIETKEEFIERRTKDIMSDGFSFEDAKAQAAEEWGMGVNRKIVKNKSKSKNLIVGLFLLLFIVVALYSCTGDSAPSVDDVEQSNSTLVESMPFNIEEAFVSTSFKNQHKYAKVSVGVHGGSRDEWLATVISIAKTVRVTGADSIEISLRQMEIPEGEALVYRELAHAYYAPNPSFSLWSHNGKGNRWDVYVAQKNKVATQKDVNVDNYYNEQYNKLRNKGIDDDSADRKAGILTAKKYGLARDFLLWSGNIDDSVDRVILNERYHVKTSKDLILLSKCIQDNSCTD